VAKAALMDRGSGRIGRRRRCNPAHADQEQSGDQRSGLPPLRQAASLDPYCAERTTRLSTGWAIGRSHFAAIASR